MSERQTDGEVRVILHLAPAWIHAETLLASPLHVVSHNLDSAVCAVLHTLPAETLCLLSPPKGDPKYARKKNPSSSRPSFFPLYIPLSHLSSLSFSLSLGLKGLCFQRKRLHSMGERGRKKKKKIIQLFCVFLPNGSCLSHCFPHSHPYTPRAVAVSKSTAEHHMGQPHTPPPPSTVLPSHTPCPPGCLSSGLFGINELIHTAPSGSIPFAARAQCKQA